MKYTELMTELMRYTDDGYREFSMRGVPSERPFLGVRIPQLRKIVAKIPADDLPELLKHEPVAIEEVMVRGMIVARFPYEEMLKLFDAQLAYIDDWCTCDTFCTGLKPVIRPCLGDFWERKVEILTRSQEEFEARVGLVLIIGSYVKYEYLQMVFEKITALAMREEYYVKMAVAWLITECFIKFPRETLAFLDNCEILDWTYNKAIAKICESCRVEKEIKAYLKTLRRIEE